MRKRFSILFVLVLTSACSSVSVDPADTVGHIAPQAVLDSSPLHDATSDIDFSQFDLLAMSPEMIEFVERNAGEAGSGTERLRQLAYAIMRSGEFSLAYEDTTGTAIETFETRRGNCMAFTNMFVAMARHVGLGASYQEVDIPPIWSSVGGSLLLSQHVNVLIELDQHSERVVDFNMAEFDFDYDRRVISDARARAHYFSNIGVEKMLAGDTELAFANFRASLREDRSFDPAWVNLGILYRREGFPDFAEAAFLHALKLDPGNLVAMSNLASLYEEQGDTARAEEYREKVKWHRMRNPYYRYQVAQADFENGDYEAAIGNLEYAIKRRKTEDRFYSLMSMSYLMAGDRDKAREWMERASEIAVEYGDKRRYNQKLELLLQSPSG